ncbi:MAG: hypothetical protein P8188_14540 [Gemmatimonadota bacterium]
MPIDLDQAIVDVDVDRYHGCAVTESNEVWCWGTNNWGNLGDGTLDSRVVPRPVIGFGAGT